MSNKEKFLVCIFYINACYEKLSFLVFLEYWKSIGKDKKY